MSIPLAIQDFLNQTGRPYRAFHHRPAYTAQEEAAVTHIPGKLWAKTVVCLADNEPVLAVLPAHYRLDLDKLRQLAGASMLRLARESEISGMYPDCETGAMPPFGPLFGERVFVDESLTRGSELVFNAGTHADAVRMSFDDFQAVTSPTIGVFGRSPAQPRTGH
ncbi:MAG: YbaK/EbsC family protein [Acidobacteriota bacterium]